jgi:hypothetical protein
MSLVINSTLTEDRLGTPRSALVIASGYGTVPAGVYFDPATGGFTIMLWIKMLIFNSPSIIDFGNGAGNDNIRLAFYGATGQPRFSTYKNMSGVAKNFSRAINLNEWSHVAVSVVGSKYFNYLNGVLVSQGTGNFFNSNNYLSSRYF